MITLERDTQNGRPIWVVYVDGSCVAYARTRAAAQSIADTQAMIMDQQARLNASAS
jgi:hypothetical protein